MTYELLLRLLALTRYSTTALSASGTIQYECDSRPPLYYDPPVTSGGHD